MPGRPRSKFVVDPGALGARIRRIRTNRGIPQDGISGVGESTVDQIERGLGVPSLDTAVKLARRFGCSLDDLVDGAVIGADAEPLAWPREPVAPSALSGVLGGGADGSDIPPAA